MATIIRNGFAQTPGTLGIRGILMADDRLLARRAFSPPDAGR